MWSARYGARREGEPATTVAERIPDKHGCCRRARNRGGAGLRQAEVHGRSLPIGVLVPQPFRRGHVSPAVQPDIGHGAQVHAGALEGFLECLGRIVCCELDAQSVLVAKEHAVAEFVPGAAFLVPRCSGFVDKQVEVVVAR